MLHHKAILDSPQRRKVVSGIPYPLAVRLLQKSMFAEPVVVASRFALKTLEKQPLLQRSASSFKVESLDWLTTWRSLQPAFRSGNRKGEPNASLTF